MANTAIHDWSAFYAILNTDPKASIRATADHLGIPAGTALTRVRRDGWSRDGAREPVKQVAKRKIVDPDAEPSPGAA
jgi:hypothetical protein